MPVLKKPELRDAGTLPKGLKILLTLGEHPEGLRFTDLSSLAGMSPSTTHRVVSMLVDYGFVEHNTDQRLYSLGLRIFELSHKVAQVKSYAETALPIMKRLADTTGMMVSLNVLDGNQMVVLERADPPQPVHVRAQIGTREPVHSTSTGKVIAASLPPDQQQELLRVISLARVTPKTITTKKAFNQELESIREHGFALSDEENQTGIRSVAVGIPNSSGHSRAALSFAGPAFLTSSEDLIALVPELKAAAQDIGNRVISHR